jgi:hypothetical protein
MTTTDLSHVASPRKCDTRHTRSLDATEGATSSATRCCSPRPTPSKPSS